MEEILVAEVGLQEGTRDDGSKWTRWKIKDGNGRTFSTFDQAYANLLQQGSKARIEFEERDIGNNRKVKNITAVEAVSNGSVPDTYSHKTPEGEPDWDKVALGKTRCALWAGLFNGLAPSLFAAAKGDIEAVRRQGAILVAFAERDIFERVAGDDAYPSEPPQGGNGDIAI